MNNPKLANCWLISSYPKINGNVSFNGNSPSTVPKLPAFKAVTIVSGRVIKVDVIISRRGGDWLGLVTWGTVEGLVEGKDGCHFFTCVEVMEFLDDIVYTIVI